MCHTHGLLIVCCVLCIWPCVQVVLSANQDTPIFLGSLHNDIDFKTSLSRADFQTMCADLIERATAPIDQALQDAQLQTVSRMNSCNFMSLFAVLCGLPVLSPYCCALILPCCHADHYACVPV